MYNHFCMHVCLSVCYILWKLYNIAIWCNMYILFASLCLPISRLGQPFVGTYNHQNFCKGPAIVSPGNMLRCSHNLSRLFRIHVFQIKKATKTLPAASRLVDGTKRPFLHVKTDIDSIFESPSGPLHIFRFDIEIIYLKYAPNPKKKATFLLPLWKDTHLALEVVARRTPLRSQVSPAWCFLPHFGDPSKTPMNRWRPEGFLKSSVFPDSAPELRVETTRSSAQWFISGRNGWYTSFIL